MKVRPSITLKLLLFILPLVFIPIAIVGYLSYNASMERMVRLSRAEQMMQARVAAAKINGIFESCRLILQTVVHLPSVQDFYALIEVSAPGTVKAGQRVVRLLGELISRSPYYLRIRLVDRRGREMVGVPSRGEDASPISLPGPALSGRNGKREGLQVSRIRSLPGHRGFMVSLAMPLFGKGEDPVGEVVIDLDYNRVIEMVGEIRAGTSGFAFMVDRLGRTIAHPRFSPYEYDLTKYPDPRLREFVIDMMAGETGWKRYYYLGEKAAAYAPVSVPKWSLAVSIPIEEFKREAEAIRRRVIQVVVATLFLVGMVVAVLSYSLLRPVRRLVAATKRIAEGDLSQEIPVKSGDELGLLTRSFNGMMVKLRDTQDELVRSEKLIALGRLSAGVAHEIRNPLNAMKGAIVHLKRRKPDDPLLQEYTGIILEEIERLNGFATDFLYFSRQSEPQPMPTDLNELLRNAMTLFYERFSEQGIEVSEHFDDSLPPIRIDPHQMEQVVVNLLINAMDAMPGGGRLNLSTAVEEQQAGNMPVKRTLVITIEDDGAGIPRGDMGSIFDPFFSTKEAGTGLGLPISVGIVESHGGRLRVRSVEGRGTTVTVRLPMDGARKGWEMEHE